MKKEEKGKGVGGDGDPPDTKQTFSSSHTSNNASPNMPYFKLDVKFELPIYNGDVDAENRATIEGRLFGGQGSGDLLPPPSSLRPYC